MDDEKKAKLLKYLDNPKHRYKSVAYVAILFGVTEIEVKFVKGYYQNQEKPLDTFRQDVLVYGASQGIAPEHTRKFLKFAEGMFQQLPNIWERVKNDIQHHKKGISEEMVQKLYAGTTGLYDHSLAD